MITPLENTRECPGILRTYKNVYTGSTSSNRYLSYNGQATYVYDNRFIFSGMCHTWDMTIMQELSLWLVPGASVGWLLSRNPG